MGNGISCWEQTWVEEPKRKVKPKISKKRSSRNRDDYGDGPDAGDFFDGSSF